MAGGSRLDMWTAAGKVQVTTSGQAATVPGTFMLGLFRNGDIRAYALRTEVCSDHCEHRAAGLSDAEPGLPPARSHLGRPPLCRPQGHTWDGPLPAARLVTPGTAPCREDPPLWGTVLVRL